MRRRAMTSFDSWLELLSYCEAVQVAEALDLVEDTIKEARAMACDDQLQIMLSIQKACILYMLGNYEASIQCLAGPHTRVCSLGDIWLELRVLCAHPVRACALMHMSLM